MILEDDYEVPRHNTLGQKKSRTEWKVENTKLWYAKKRQNVNSQDQVMRNAENGYNERTAACTYDAAKYIVNKHYELGYAGIAKTFKSLQEDVYGIRCKDIGWLISRCSIYNFQRPSNTKAPLEPIIIDRVIECLQIDLINFRHSSDGHYKWILHAKDHFLKYITLFALKSKLTLDVASSLAIFLMCFGPPEIV